MNVHQSNKAKIFKVGDVCIRTDNGIAPNEPKVFTTHKVDMEWGVVYYYNFEGKENSIGIAYVEKYLSKIELAKEIKEEVERLKLANQDPGQALADHIDGIVLDKMLDLAKQK